MFCLVLCRLFCLNISSFISDIQGCCKTKANKKKTRRTDSANIIKRNAFRWASELIDGPWKASRRIQSSDTQVVRMLPRRAMWANIPCWGSRPTQRVWTWESVMDWFWNLLGDTQASGQSVKASSPTPPKCSTHPKQENIKKSGPLPVQPLFFLESEFVLP